MFLKIKFHNFFVNNFLKKNLRKNLKILLGNTNKQEVKDSE
jgi:hypothetical protein